MLSHRSFVRSATFLPASHFLRTTVSWWSSVFLLHTLCRQIAADVLEGSTCAHRRVRKSEGHYKAENTVAVLLNQRCWNCRLTREHKGFNLFQTFQSAMNQDPQVFIVCQQREADIPEQVTLVLPVCSTCTSLIYHCWLHIAAGMCTMLLTYTNRTNSRNKVVSNRNVRPLFLEWD